MLDDWVRLAVAIHGRKTSDAQFKKYSVLHVTHLRVTTYSGQVFLLRSASSLINLFRRYKPHSELFT